jgi:hypothetical protein
VKWPPSWFPVGRHEQINIVLTFAIVLLTAGNVAVSFWYASITKRAAEDSGRQTKKLISAANIQACAANSFSESAGEIKNQISKAVLDFEHAAQQSARDSERAARNAEATIKQAEVIFRDEQRAWIGVHTFAVDQLERGKDYQVSIQLLNSGRSPGINVEESGRYSFEPVSVVEPAPGPILRKPTAAIPPQGIIVIHILIHADEITSRFDEISASSSIIYTAGRIEYDDTSQRRHTTNFCLFLSGPAKKTLSYCDKGNNMD